MLIVFVYIFIRVFVGTTLCDVLDKKGDLATGVETIPIRLGRNKTKKLLLASKQPRHAFANLLRSNWDAHSFHACTAIWSFIWIFAIWFFFKTNCKRFTAGLMLDGEWIPNNNDHLFVHQMKKIRMKGFLLIIWIF